MKDGSLIVTFGLVVYCLIFLIVSFGSDRNLFGRDQIGFSKSMISNIAESTGQISSSPPSNPPSGFVATGSINSVINLPAHKWLAAGNFSMILNDNNVTSFGTNMTWYNSTGTNAHTHELNNFKPINTGGALLVNQSSKDIVITGFADVGTNHKTSWMGVPITITISGHKVVSISLDDNKTNHHFGGQPILGIIQTFFVCSDLPAPNMEILPPCDVTGVQPNSFQVINSTVPSTLPSGFTTTPGNPNSTSEQEQSSQQSLPSYFTPTNNTPNNNLDSANEKYFPDEESRHSGDSSEKVQSNLGVKSNCSRLDIASINSNGFENDSADRHPAVDAIDGKSSTWWANQGNSSWLQVALEKESKLCDVSILWNKGNSRQFTFDVSVSQDGVNFQNVFSGKNKGTLKTETYNFEPITGRYVKLTIVDTSSKGGWVSIKEINVKGTR